MTYVVTAAGKRLDLLRPDPSLIEWDDVAARLHRINRYAGMAVGEHPESILAQGGYPQRWSVAQHTLLVMMLVGAAGKKAEAYALLHDAHEGYLGDWITPVKQAVRHRPHGFYADMELRGLEYFVAQAIHVRAGLNYPAGDVLDDVTDADRLAYAIEVTHLIAPHQAREFTLFDHQPEIVAHGAEALRAIAAIPDVVGFLANSIRSAIGEGT